jgi:hypothetical protein
MRFPKNPPPGFLRGRQGKTVALPATCGYNFLRPGLFGANCHPGGRTPIYKLFVNTIYGALSSRFFSIGNVVLANNITARGRVGVWMLSKALRLRQSITDGGIYEPWTRQTWTHSLWPTSGSSGGPTACRAAMPGRRLPPLPGPGARPPSPQGAGRRLRPGFDGLSRRDISKSHGRYASR